MTSVNGDGDRLPIASWPRVSAFHQRSLDTEEPLLPGGELDHAPGHGAITFVDPGPARREDHRVIRRCGCAGEALGHRGRASSGTYPGCAATRPIHSRTLGQASRSWPPSSATCEYAYSAMSAML